MLKKIQENFDLRTFAITFGIFFIWILVSDYVVNTFLSAQYAQVAQYVKGTLFVLLMSVILSVVHGHENKVHRDREIDFDRLFRETITPTLLVDVNTNQVMDANHAALKLMSETQESVTKKKLRDIFSDLKNWKHLLLEIATTQKGQAHFNGELLTSLGTKLQLEMKVSHFEFGKRDMYLIFFQERKLAEELEDVGEGRAVASVPESSEIAASGRV